ncbi:MAG TPA: FAD/NAD(P)-binding protein [Bauldia sp.]|nr:FAD/NAD(P)-binding protein [Bauldia sp.]
MSTARLAEPSRPAPVADPMRPVFGRIAENRREGADIWTLALEPEGGFVFAPGQFNMLYAFGVGEAAISISGDPAEPARLVHTIRSVGAVSEALTRLEAGDRVGIRGPYGRGWPVEAASGQDVVIIAGGLGLAPLRPAIYSVLGNRSSFGRVAILYGTRSPADILFESELRDWRTRLDVEVEVTVDHAAADWHGNVGVATTLIPRIAFDPAKSLAMVCGPEIMMRFAVAGLKEAGMPDTAIYLSMERNMKCAVGHCGHCQFGGAFVCKDGPVFGYDRLRQILALREI